MDLIIQLLFVLVDEHLLSLLRAVLTLGSCTLFIRYIHIYLSLDIGLRMLQEYFSVFPLEEVVCSLAG